MNEKLTNILDEYYQLVVWRHVGNWYANITPYDESRPHFKNDSGHETKEAAIEAAVGRHFQSNKYCPHCGKKV